MLKSITYSLIKELKTLVDPITHISDSEASYEVSAIGGAGQDMISILKGFENKPMEILSGDKFFSKLTRLHPWVSDEERFRIYRYREIENFFKTKLRDVKVIKSGEVYLEVYVMGKTSEEDFVILSTSELYLPKYITADY